MKSASCLAGVVLAFMLVLLGACTPTTQNGGTLAPHHLADILTRARALTSRGEAAKALALLGRVLDQVPPSPDILTALGDAHLASGAYQDAARAYFSALEAQPEHWRALVGMGHLLVVLDRPQAARAWYYAARRAVPPALARIIQI